MFSFKKVALIIAAVLAFGGIAVSAASAQEFTASKYPTTATDFSSKGNDNFKTEAGSVECTVHYALGALSGPSEAATLTPTYTECQAFGFLSATVSMNGCDYVLHANGTFDIECPTGKTIVISASTCEVTVGSQTGLGSVTLANAGTNITAKLNLTGIAYTVTKDGFLCPFSGTGAKTGATYTQAAALTLVPTNGATIDIGESPPPSGEFTASSYPTSATAASAKGNDAFSTEAGSMECKVHYAAAALTESSKTLTVTPTFSECQAFGFLESTVSTNGCDYVIHTNGEVDIECPAGNAIKIVAATCEATIGTQTGLKSVTLANSGSDITAQFGLSGIAYTVTKDGFLCPFSGTGAKTGATYTQNSAITYKSTSGTTIDIG